MTAMHEFVSVDKALQEKMKTYCHTDKQAICPDCAVDHHEGHEIDRITKVAQGFKEEISSQTDKVPFLSFSFPFYFLISSLVPFVV